MLLCKSHSHVFNCFSGNSAPSHVLALRAWHWLVKPLCIVGTRLSGDQVSPTIILLNLVGRFGFPRR
jgi:hypothetical protein